MCYACVCVCWVHTNTIHQRQRSRRRLLLLLLVLLLFVVAGSARFYLRFAHEWLLLLLLELYINCKACGEGAAADGEG